MSFALGHILSDWIKGSGHLCVGTQEQILYKEKWQYFGQSLMNVQFITVAFFLSETKLRPPGGWSKHLKSIYNKFKVPEIRPLRKCHYILISLYGMTFSWPLFGPFLI